jgi:eukaryotic-like serine/threonine-protein kinase
MGEVWGATAEVGFGVERRVALKFVESRGRHATLFFDEVAVLARLHHPHLVQLIDSGQHEDRYWYAMEWIPGQTLLAVMRPGQVLRPLPASVAISIALDLCDGLGAVHDARDEQGTVLGIVHRDVAPANVIITDTGLCKLIDFGIAWSSARQAAATQAGVVRGRIAYLAPERLLNDNVDGRSDQWALGVLLLEMLTGRRCFDEADAAATMRAILERAVDVSSVAGPLRPVVGRMVAVRAADRFPDMRAARRALESAAGALRVTPSHSVVQRFVRGEAPAPTARDATTDAGPPSSRPDAASTLDSESLETDTRPGLDVVPPRPSARVPRPAARPSRPSRPNRPAHARAPSGRRWRLALLVSTLALGFAGAALWPWRAEPEGPRAVAAMPDVAPAPAPAAEAAPIPETLGAAAHAPPDAGPPTTPLKKPRPRPRAIDQLQPLE